MESSFTLLGVKLSLIKDEQLKPMVRRVLNGHKQFRMTKINAEFIQRCQNDNRFREVVNSSDINLVDGRGVQWAGRYLTLPVSKNHIIRPAQSVLQMILSGAKIVFNPSHIQYPITKVFPGVEIFKSLMQIVAEENKSVFLFGSSDDVLDLSKAALLKDYPNLKIAGTLNGYDFQKDGNKIDPTKIINATDASIVIVALGSPRQEYWIKDNLEKMPHIKLAVGEGGTLDRLAYPKQLAPNFINKIGLEWLWRVLFNKSKTASRNRFQRFWVSVPSFITRIVKWKVKNGEAKIKD